MFTEIENSIILRLTDKLDPGIKVLRESELSRVGDLRQKAPAVFVVLDGYDLGDSIPNVPNVQQIVLRWYIVVAVKSASGNGDTAEAKNGVSDIAESVIRALLGYQALPGKRMRMETSPGPEYDGGFCYLPIGFTCKASFHGDAN